MLSNMKALVGVVLILSGFAYFLVNNGDVNDSSGEGAWLLPQLQGDVTGQLTEIRIAKDSAQLAIVKNGQEWYLKNGFYADTAPMMQLLQALRSAEKIEAKTRNPENFEQLELSNSDLTVSLIADDKTIAAVHLGKKATAPGASFARLVGEDQTWLVSAIDQVTYMSNDWQLKTIIDESADNLMQVHIDNGTNDVLLIKRGATTGVWELANIPEGKQAKVGSSLLSVASGLSSFGIDAAMPVDLTDKALKITANYKMINGSEVEVKVYQHAAEYFATMNLDKYKNWMFKIPSYKFDALNKSMSEFIDDNMVSSESAENPDAQ